MFLLNIRGLGLIRCNPIEFSGATPSSSIPQFSFWSPEHHLEHIIYISNYSILCLFYGGMQVSQMTYTMLTLHTQVLSSFACCNIRVNSEKCFIKTENI